MDSSGGLQTERKESESSTCDRTTNDSLRAFLEREHLGHLIKFFPEDLSLGYLRSLTDDELEQDYNVRNDKDRAQLVRAIVKLRDDYSDDEEHETDSEFQNSADSQSEVFMSTTLPSNFRRFPDECGDSRQKRRESFAYLSPRFEETSNLVRMRNTPTLGNSEPNLSGSCGNLTNQRPSSFSSSRRAAKSFIGTSSPSNHHRSFSPNSPNSSFTQASSSDSPVGSPNFVSQNPTFASHFAFSNVRKADGAGRRWSVASLTSSGYGTHTPCSSSYSSLASSQEKLHQFQAVPYAEDMCNYMPPSGCSAESDQDEEFGSGHWSSKPRQRARSLSPPRSWLRQHGDDLQALNNMYRERFPTAVKQMEEKLSELLEEYSTESGSARSGCDGVLHFVLHQVVEFARDVLKQSQEGSLTSGYFYKLSENLERLFGEARKKTDVDATPVKRLIRKLLVIVSRPSRLLECLEFSPEEFYSQLEVDSRELSTSEDTQSITDYVKMMLDVNRDMPGSPGHRDSPSPESASDSESASTTKEADLPLEEDFEYIKLISNGAYGAVYLVRHKRTAMRFAMKKMNKQLMTHRNQVDQVFAERDILTFSDNPFVVGMWCCFETKKHLCMVMEYVEGGDCASLLKNMGPLPVDLARMYFAETVLAVEYLHSYGIIHRDIKPDNLLITAMGHIKLTDFGLSKIGLMSFTTHMFEQSLDQSTKQFTDNQVYGTPDYVAPEVILRQGYGKPVDWWAMGIILYEFLVGLPPFYGDSPEELFAHTLSGDLDWPEGDEAPTEDSQALVISLLEQDPLQRLGTAGAFEVKEHRFFHGLDWTALLRQKAEFIPQLDDDEDTSYFDTRTDRYNHDLETDDDDDVEDDILEFSNFSTCSPRYSRILSPGPISPVSCDEKKDDSKKSASGRDSRSSESSPPTVRRKSLKKKASDLSDEQSESRESDEEQPRRRRSDSGISRDLTRQTSSSSSTTDSPCTPVQAQDSPSTPPTPPTVRHRKAAVVAVPSQLKESPSIDSRPSQPSRAEASERTGEKQTLSRTKSLPPVPKLELTLSDDENRSVVRSLDSPPLSPRPSTPRTRSPNRRRTNTLSLSLRPPIVIEKGPRGYGFTLQAIRVYYGDTNYYTVHHLVSNVDHGSAAFESGLRPGDLLTHINDEPITGLSHRQVIEHILSGGNKITLTATELGKTSIKTGGRKRQLSASKRVKKKIPSRRSRRTVSSPTLPSPPAEQSDRPRNKSFWKRLARSGSFTRSRSSSLRRTSSLKRMSTQEGKFHPPLSPKHGSPPFDFRNVSDHSSSSVGSSPSSSPSSPSAHSFERPGSLHGLIPKLRAVRSPRRKSSVHVPVSPLARTPSPTAASQSSHQQRSTSPLTLRCSPAGSPHFVTVPSSSPRPGSPLLRRALSPEHFHVVAGKPEGSRKSKGERSRRISVDHARSIKSDIKVQRSRSLREEYTTGKPKLETRLFEQKFPDGRSGKSRNSPSATEAKGSNSLNPRKE